MIRIARVLSLGALASIVAACAGLPAGQRLTPERESFWTALPAHCGRACTDRRFRVEFELTRPVGPPPAPWGS